MEFPPNSYNQSEHRIFYQITIQEKNTPAGLLSEQFSK